MKIGILQTGQAPETIRGALGDYPELFAQLARGNTRRHRRIERRQSSPRLLDCGSVGLLTGATRVPGLSGITNRVRWFLCGCYNSTFPG